MHTGVGRVSKPSGCVTCSRCGEETEVTLPVSTTVTALENRCLGQPMIWKATIHPIRVVYYLDPTDVSQFPPVATAVCSHCVVGVDDRLKQRWKTSKDAHNAVD